MQDISQVIVPVDFQQHTDTVAKYALELAFRIGARVTFLHVVEPLGRTIACTDLSATTYGDLYPAACIELDAKMLELSRTRMHALVGRYQADFPGCEGVVLEGDAADTIVACSMEQGADLIVMGTHGARGIEKILLGSVCERVLKRAACPVLVVNPYRGERGYRITRSPGDAAPSA